MNTQDLLSIKKHIGTGKLNLGLEQLQALCEKSKYEYKCLSLVARYHDLEEANEQGTVSYEEFTRTKNQILKATLQLLEQIELSTKSNDLPTHNKAAKNQASPKRTGLPRLGNIILTRKSNVRFNFP